MTTPDSLTLLTLRTALLRIYDLSMAGSLSARLDIREVARAALAPSTEPTGDSRQSEGLRGKADALLDAVEEAIGSEALPGNIHHRLSEAFNAVVALAATPEPTLDAERPWNTDLTYEETTRLARAISQADHMNWPSRVIAEKIAGTVRAIAAARLHERTEPQEPGS